MNKYASMATLRHIRRLKRMPDNKNYIYAQKYAGNFF